MNVIQQLVSDEIERMRELVADADQRLNDAKTQLAEAKANAQKAHDDFDQLKAWLAASMA